MLVAFGCLVVSSVPAVLYLRSLHGDTSELGVMMPNRIPALVIAFAVLSCWLGLTIMGDGRFRWSDWAVHAMLALVLVGIIAWYLVFAPAWAPGSDNADALERGAMQILNGQNPYWAVTKFGNTLSPMLGGILLALPFVVMFGSTYLMIPLLIFASVAGLYRWAGPRPALAALTVFASSVWTRLALPSQSDNWLTSAAVVAAGCFGYWAIRRRSVGWELLSAASYGVALSYRLLLWPTVLPLLVFFVRAFGWRRTWRWMLVAGLMAMFLIGLPFAFDPQAYVNGPWIHGLEKAGRSTLPYAGVIVAVVGVIGTVLASTRVRSLAGAWGASAASVGSVLAAVAITKFSLGPVDMISTYDTVAYTGTWLVFAVVALVLPRRGDVAGDTATEADGARESGHDAAGRAPVGIAT
jgi:hypothetical protein